MPTATEDDVRFYLPQSIESVPTSSEITTALGKAERKVDGYTNVTDSDRISDAEAIYAALQLLEHKYPMPEELDGPANSETFPEAPQETLRKKFKRITNGGWRVI